VNLSPEQEAKFLEVAERALLAPQNLDITVESLVTEMKQTREDDRDSLDRS
jgi:hypothetical protein